MQKIKIGETDEASCKERIMTSAYYLGYKVNVQ